MKQIKKVTVIPLMAVALLMGGMITGYASLAGAQTADGTTTGTTERASRPGKGSHGKGPGVMGTVTAVNGSTITVTGKNGTSYTVQAGSAKVHKVVEVSLSDIAVGDSIGVQGTVSGTTVTAQNIMDDVKAPPKK